MLCCILHAQASACTVQATNLRRLHPIPSGNKSARSFAPAVPPLRFLPLSLKLPDSLRLSLGLPFLATTTGDWGSGGTIFPGPLASEDHPQGMPDPSLPVFPSCWAKRSSPNPNAISIRIWPSYSMPTNFDFVCKNYRVYTMSYAGSAPDRIYC